MIEFFVIQIKLGRITIYQVPDKYKEAVEQALNIFETGT